MRVLILLLFTLFQAVLSIVNPLNGHDYTIVTGVVSWEQANAAAIAAGGYLATITSQAEYNFIRDSVLTSEVYVWIGAHSNDSTYPDGHLFSWRSGPESGQPMFDRQRNQCYSLCEWLPYQPDLGSLVERYVHLWTSKRMNDVILSWTGIQGYMIETGGASDPYMVLPSTDDTSVQFNNVLASPTSISFTSLNGKTSFSCTPTYSSTAKTATCPLSYTMSGEYNITITTASTTYSLNRVHPRMPYVSSIIPGSASGSIVTINGESFSDNIAEIQVQVSFTLIACTPIKYLVPHRSFTCSLVSALSSTTNDYITVSVNGIITANATRVPQLNTATTHLISHTSNVGGNYSPGFITEGMTGVDYVPNLLSDRSFLTFLENTSPAVACVRFTYVSSLNFKLADGVNPGLNFVNGATCGFTSPCSIDSSLSAVTSNTTALTFVATNGTFTTTLDCRFIFYFPISTTGPVFSTTQTILSPTYGSLVTITLTGLKLTSSNYTLVYRGVNIAYPIIPLFNTPSLKFNVPVGIGTSTPLTVYIDGVTTSSNLPQIGYIAPSLTSMTTLISTTGGTLTVVGDNLGANTSDLQVNLVNTVGSATKTFTVSNLQWVTAHKSFSLSLPAGIGSYSVNVTVGGQLSGKLTSTYAIPVISSVSQSGSTFILTGTNYGTDLTAVSLMLGTVTATGLTSLSSTTFQFSLASTAVDGNFIIIVGGLASLPYSFQLTPYLVQASPTISAGGSSSITGYWMTKLTTVYFNGVSLGTPTSVTATQAQFNVPAGSGYTNTIYATSSTGKTSNSIVFFYIAVINSYRHNGNTTLFIEGVNFWSNTTVLLPGKAATQALDFTSETELIATIDLTTREGGVIIYYGSSIYYGPTFTPTPYIESITSVPVTGGLITITGRFLSTNSTYDTPITTAVQIGSYTCSSPVTVDQVQYSKLQCSMPQGYGSNLSVSVSIDGVANAGSVLFSYVSPVIQSVTQNSDSTISIHGSNFVDISLTKVTLNGIALTCSVITAGTDIQCNLIQSSSSGPVIFYNNNQPSNSYTVLLTPILSSVTPVLATDTSITITGSYLRNTMGTSTYSAQIGSTSCILVQNIQNTDNIICALSSSSPLSQSTTPSIVVVVNNKVSNSLPVSYSLTLISSVSQSSQTILISGTNLGNSDNLPIVTLSTQTLTCTITQYQLTVQCNLPINSASGSLTYQGYGSLVTKTFNLTPILTSITSGLSEGSIVTLSGFYVSEVSKIQIGSSIAITSSITVVDYQTLQFTVSGQGVNLNTYITTSKAVTSNSIQYSFLPEIKSISHTNATQLGINGFNFDSDSVVSINGEAYSASTTIISSLTLINQTIPLTLKNGIVSVTSHQSTTQLKLSLTPFLQSSSSVKAVGGVVTIFGNFLSITNNSGSSLPVSITIGSQQCISPSNPDNDNLKLSCTIGPGTGANYPITVTIDGVTNLGSATFSYGTPSIQNVAQNSSQMIIVGESFGTAASNIQVFLNSVQLTNIINSKDSSITVSLPQSSASGNVYVSVSGQSSNQVPISLTPILDSMVPALSNSPSITINGWYFNSNSSDTVYSGTVGGLNCLSVTHQSNSNSVVCNLDSNTTYTFPNTPKITISVNGLQSNAIDYSYSAPVVSIVSQNLQNSITITGNNLGNLDSMSTVTLSGSVLQCQTTSQLSLTCSLENSSKSGTLSVSNYGQTTSYTLTLQPVLTGISSVPSSGGVVTLTGYFFQGTSNIYISGSAITTPITIVDLNTLTFTYSGVGINLPTSIQTSYGGFSNSILFSFKVELTGYIHSGDSKLTLIGKNFDTDSIININSEDYVSDTTDVVTTSQIIQNIPDTLENGNVTVTSHSFNSSESFKLTPFLTSVTSVSTDGGEITIFGKFLNTLRNNNEATNVSILVGSQTCTFISDIGSNTGLVCSLPAGTGFNIPVSVSIDQVQNMGSIGFSYGKPSVTAVTQNQKSITIQGSGFGSDIGSITVTYNNITLVSCNLTGFNLVCTLPSTIQNNGQVQVSVSGQDSNALSIQLSPIIDNMTPTSSIASTITLVGSFLLQNSQDDVYSVKIGSTICSSVSQFNDSSITCTLPNNAYPANSETTPSISLSINAQSGLNSILYQYDMPAITSISQNQYKLELSGNTFGNNDSAPIVKFGALTLSCKMISPQTQLECDLPLTAVNSIATVFNYQGKGQSNGLTLTPIITGATKSSTSGGDIFLSADYINDLLQNNAYNYTANVQGQLTTLNTGLDANNSPSISLTLPSSLPTNFSIYITVDSKQSNTFISNYLSPIINSYSQDDYILTIQGDSFGLSNSDSISLLITSSTLPCLIISNHTEITCDLTNSSSVVESGLIQVYRDSKVFISTSSQVYLTPMITSVTSPNVIGGIVTINGYFLNQINPSNQIPMNIFTSFSSSKAVVKSSNNRAIIATVDQGAHGVQNMINISLIPSGISQTFTSKAFTFSAQSPQIEQVVTNGRFYYPSSGNVTIVGENFIPQPIANITIGGKTCVNPVYISNEKYICNFEGDIPMVDNYGLSVEIECDTLTDTGDYFYYDQNIPCSPECQNGGTCNQGVCSCPSGYSGISCQNQTNSGQPSEVHPGGAQFSSISVYFSHVREINSIDGSTVLIYPITNVTWINSTQTLYPSYNEIESVGVLGYYETSEENASDYSKMIQINVKSFVFSADDSFYFGGERIDMKTNDLKYQVSVANWPFSSSLNTLELIYSLAAPSSSKTACDEDVQTTSTTSSDSEDLRYIQIQMNGQTFISQFSKRVILDKRVTTGNTRLLKSTDSIYQLLNSTAESTTAVALVVPNFSSQVTVDPNFSLLISTTTDQSTDCGTSTKKQSLWYISIIVVGACLAIVGVIVGVHFYRKSKKQKSIKNRFSIGLNKISSK